MNGRDSVGRMVASGSQAAPAGFRVLSESTAHHPHRRCPQCRAPVKRVLRSANDKRMVDADHWRRYRCRSDSCGWQGLLPTAGRRRVRRPVGRGTPVLVRMGRTALLLLLAAGLTWGCLQALQFLMDS